MNSLLWLIQIIDSARPMATTIETRQMEKQILLTTLMDAAGRNQRPV
ncbi:hypothetical protein WQQ_24900 [Hydrocarboniphaga effusa AP103]|uniref:Uncharacterized protein n=1 Tax=Hydrocarboniphaga effusa AP103 TaxID=1172194 RepID=I8T5A4_9GAMM|nr:hypothetical protein WQQ_24900 [Hydrocarboniphaga effusa AP103]